MRYEMGRGSGNGSRRGVGVVDESGCLLVARCFGWLVLDRIFFVFFSPALKAEEKPWSTSGQGIGLIKVRSHGEVLNEYSTYQEKKCAKKVQHTTEGHLTRTIGTLYRYRYFTG